MKILHIVWGMENGGAENMLADIINYQVVTEDVSLLIINNMYDNYILSRINKRCKILCLKRRVGSKNPYCFIKLNLLILFNRYDIVHLHQNTLIGKLFVRANYVRTVHNTNQSFHDYRNHKCIIAISEAVKKELDTLGYTESVLINNGINFNMINHTKKDLLKDQFKIVQVSRILFRQKGQDILLDAFKKVVESGMKNVHLYFIGDGPDIEKLKLMIIKYGLSDYVSLLGNRSRDYIYKNLCKYDLFVQPSRFEGFGLTVVEAMAAKIPVLVSRNDGPFQIIKKGQYGFSFDNENSEDAAKQLINLINNYPNSEFLEDVYNYALASYSVKRTAELYLNEYRKIYNKC